MTIHSIITFTISIGTILAPSRVRHIVFGNRQVRSCNPRGGQPRNNWSNWTMAIEKLHDRARRVSQRVWNISGPVIKAPIAIGHQFEAYSILLSKGGRKAHCRPTYICAISTNAVILWLASKLFIILVWARITQNRTWFWSGLSHSAPTYSQPWPAPTLINSAKSGQYFFMPLIFCKI